MDLTIKESLYIQARLEGKSQIDAGLAAGSKTVEGARKLAQRMSHNVAVQNALQNMLDIQLVKHNITYDRILQNIDDALQATKQNNFTGEVTADHQTRLKASTMALDLIERQTPKTPQSPQPKLPQNLGAEFDEIELQKAIFRKDQPIDQSTN